MAGRLQNLGLKAAAAAEVTAAVSIFPAGPLNDRYLLSGSHRTSVLDVRFVAHCGRKSVTLGGPKSAGSDVGSQYAETILF